MRYVPKKLVLLISICLCALQISFAQINLIQDPSFEDTISTSHATYCLSSVLKHWTSLENNHCNNVNYNNYGNATICSTSLNADFKLPLNWWVYQYPKTGYTVADIYFIYCQSNCPYSKRAFLKTKLKTKLIAGKTYCAKLYVNPHDQHDRITQDGLAMYFDTGQLDTIYNTDSSGVYPFVQPQVSNPQGHLITDTAGWTKVSGTFVANGTEQYITIGNFKTDANTDTAALLPNSTYLTCEFLIEDVCVYPVDATNWLHDTFGVAGDSVWIGLPNYEVPDGQWYNDAGVLIDSGSQIKVAVPTKGTFTTYIQGIDVCDKMVFDTMRVYNHPINTGQFVGNAELNKTGVRVYPNPTAAGFYIKQTHTSPSVIQVKLYNLQGQLVASHTCQPSNADCFIAAKLLTGTYIIKITDNDNVFTTKLQVLAD